jgi:hypothetical protein
MIFSEHINQSTRFQSGEGKCTTLVHYNQPAGSSATYNSSFLIFHVPRISRHVPSCCPSRFLGPYVLSRAGMWLYMHFVR